MKKILLAIIMFLIIIFSAVLINHIISKESIEINQDDEIKNKTDELLSEIDEIIINEDEEIEIGEMI